jgi:hypothetical protein
MHYNHKRTLKLLKEMIKVKKIRITLNMKNHIMIKCKNNKHENYKKEFNQE